MTNSTVRKIQLNIKKYRKQRKMTQDQLSELCGISQDYLSEIERGKKKPSLETLITIAEKLEILPQKLFDD